MIKNSVYRATKVANITEADVFYNNAADNYFTSEAFWLKYYEGISSAYQYTIYDPYYDGDGKRSEVNLLSSKKQKEAKKQKIMKWLPRKLKS